jgi:hypothetical protein
MRLKNQTLFITNYVQSPLARNLPESLTCGSTIIEVLQAQTGHRLWPSILGQAAMEHLTVVSFLISQETSLVGHFMRGMKRVGIVYVGESDHFGNRRVDLLVGLACGFP